MAYRFYMLLKVLPKTENEFLKKAVENKILHIYIIFSEKSYHFKWKYKVAKNFLNKV